MATCRCSSTKDVRSFRMFTSQMIEGGTVKPNEIVKTFGVPMIAVGSQVEERPRGGAEGHGGQ